MTDINNDISDRQAAHFKDMRGERTTTTARRIRWSWFPSLLFGDGLLASVMALTILMLRRFGLGYTLTTLYVSLLCLPFLARPLMEMVVTYFRGTTKVWILSTEFLTSMSLWAIAFTIPTSYWLEGTMCFMPFVTISGVFHDIAVGRFYLEDKPTRSSMQDTLALLFRLTALSFGIGALAMVAGNMEVVTRNVRYSWSIVFYVIAGVEFFLWLWHSIFLPGGRRPQATEKDLFGLQEGEYNAATGEMTGSWRRRIQLYSFILFAIPIALLTPVTPLFIIDASHNSGLGLSPQEFAFVQGTIGVIFVFVGCVASRYAIGRYGKCKGVVPLSIAMASQGMSLTFLASDTTASLGTICMAMAVNGLAVGASVAIYTFLTDDFARSARGTVIRRATARSLGSMATVGIGMFSGMILADIGYRQYFEATTATYAVAVVAVISYLLSARKR